MCAKLRLCCVYWKSVCVFQVSTLLTRNSGKRAKLHICARRSACAASIEHVFVFKSFWSGTPAGLSGSLSECFVQACTTWLNCRRLTKVLFSTYNLISSLSLCNFVHLFTNIYLQTKWTKHYQNVFSISWLVHFLFYSWQSYSLSIWPQKLTMSAYIYVKSVSSFDRY